jgi:DNA polymerase-3 subunit epsilon
MAMYPTFIAFDVETTGLDYKKDQIIELAGEKYTLELKGDKLVTKHLDSFESFVKPTMFIPQEATNINHITNEMVEDAPPVKQVLEEFTRFCGLSSILVAHNADFDTKFIYAGAKEVGIQPVKNPVYDSLKLARKIMPEASSYKLGELAKRMRRHMNLTLDSDKLHRALYDCEVLREVFLQILLKRFTIKDFDLSVFLKQIEKIHGQAYLPKR